MKRGTTEIYGVERGQTPIRTIFRNGYKVFGSEGHVQTPCFEVVETLSGATGDFVDVYCNADEKWYKKNNLNEYEEYGIMPTVDSLSGVTYYTGKLVILSTDSHEYKWNGSSWTDLGEMSDTYTEYDYVQGNGTSYIKTDYVPVTDTRYECDMQGRLAPSSTSTEGECSWLGGIESRGTAASRTNRFRVLYSGNPPGIRYDYSNAEAISQDSRIITRGVIKLDKTGGYFNDDQLVTFTNPQVISNAKCHCGIFGSLEYNLSTDVESVVQVIYAGKIYSFKIYEGETLVRNFVPAEKNGVVGMYETVNGVMYGSEVSTPFTVGGNSTEHGNIPEEYDTKVAPANHVEYQTLEQLEAMECPWVGMEAKVSGVLYLYTENGWEQQQTPCFEVVDVLSAATGNYVDVYNQSDEKWYKKNNLNEYEQYGLRPEVDSLSGLTYYTGKLAVNTTDNHEYKWNGSSWTDLGEVVTSGTSEYFLAASDQDSSHRAFFYPGYYFGDGYHLELDISFTTYNSLSLFTCNNSLQGTINSPIEFVTYQNGFYNDFHAPLSTSDNSCYTGDYSQRNIVTSMGISPLINRRFRIRVGTVDVKWFDYETGTQLYSGGSTYSGYNWYNGLYFGEIRCDENYTFRYKGYKVYDANDNLVNDVEARYRSGTTEDKQIYFHDNVLNVDYENVTNNPVGYYEQGDYVTVYPEDYQTKVAPANNVSYNTLEELEMMECPWYGMRAYVNGVMYEYGDWGWQLPRRFITFTSDGEWTDSEYPFTDYLTQQSNNLASMDGYKCVKVEWLGYPEFFINVDSYGYANNRQYLCAMNMDGDKPASMPAYNTTGVKCSTRNYHDNPNTLSNYKPVLYQNDGEVHHAWIVYRQDSSLNSTAYPNKGYIAVLDYTTVNNVEYRVSQTEYLGSDGTYYEKVYQWYQKNGTWTQSNNWKQGEQLQTANRVSQNEYLGSNGTYYQKVYVDVVTPDGTQRTTGYYVQGSQLPTTYIDTQTEYIGSDPYYAKSYCYVTTPDNVQRKTTYYVKGQQLNTTETWKGETILWDDCKRYKYNVVNIELLNGSIVQPNELATRKGDYIEDVTPVVPSSGYTQLDWIETTEQLNGIYKPRIELGFKLSGTCDVYIDMVIPQTPTNNVVNGYYRDFFGADKFWLVSALDPGFKCCMGACYNTSIMLWNQSPYYRWPLFNERHVFNYNNTGVYYKSYSASTWSDMSEEIAAEGHTIPVGTDQVSDYDVWLFARNQNSSFYNSIVRVYNVTIKDKDSGTVLHNFVPCFQTSGNRLGLYDTVTGSFRETYAASTNTLNKNFNCGVTCIEGTTTNSASTYKIADNLVLRTVDNGQTEKPFYGCYSDIRYSQLATTNMLNTSVGYGTKTITKFNARNINNNGFHSFCSGNKEITSVDVSGVGYVGTGLNFLFESASNISYINANGWDTSNVTNMYQTFYNCTSLVECDIRSWSTESLTSYNLMFVDCTSLNKLYIGSGFFNSPTITNYNMFRTLSAWTDPTSLAMFVDAITSHDGTGKTVTLHANTKAALSSAQIAAIEAANWTIA